MFCCDCATHFVDGRWPTREDPFSWGAPIPSLGGPKLCGGGGGNDLDSVSLRFQAIYMYRDQKVKNVMAVRNALVLKGESAYSSNGRQPDQNWYWSRSGRCWEAWKLNAVSKELSLSTFMGLTSSITQGRENTVIRLVRLSNTGLTKAIKSIVNSSASGLQRLACVIVFITVFHACLGKTSPIANV